MSHNKTLSFPDEDWILINNYFVKNPRFHQTKTMREWIMNGLLQDDPTITAETKVMLEKKETDIQTVGKELCRVISEKGRLRNEAIVGVIVACMDTDIPTAKKFASLILKSPGLYGLRWDAGFINVREG